MTMTVYAYSTDADDNVVRIVDADEDTFSFVEPIEAWDEPRLLRFAVTSNPAPMREWNPLFEIHPPHLDGFLVAKRGQFLLTPLPNHLFQRDNSAWVYGGVSINPMAKPARKRKTINSRVVYNFHPMFRDAEFDVLYGNDSLAHEPATIEGGDVTVIGNRAVMIGMGERTTPQGV